MKGSVLFLVVLVCGCQGGGSSGTDFGGTNPPDTRAPDALVETVCPPPGPHGHDVGDRVANIIWTDCDGAPVALHDLCGERAVLVVNFYGWCASCYRYLIAANELQTAYAARGLRTIIVISEGPLEVPATAEYCREVRARYDLTATVVFDVDLQLEAYGDVDLVLIVDRDGQLVFKRQGATVGAIERALEAELAR